MSSKYSETIADNLSKAGVELGCVSAWIPTSERSLGQVSISLRLSGVYHAKYFLLMTTKFLALMSAIGLGTVCGVQAQSPTPDESPTASPSPTEKVASPLPAESPPASPKAKPTPKKAKAETKPRPGASPVPAGRTTEKATSPQAPGGGPGLVWVNTEAGVYHGQRSPFYGTTAKGKYMTEQDAIQAGYKRAPKER